MKGIIDYIFRPSTHDAEVEKSIYKGMVRTTRAMVAFTMAQDPLSFVPAHRLLLADPRELRAEGF